MNNSDKIFIAGHNGLVGSAIYRRGIQLGFENILIIDKSKLDLRNQNQVKEYFNKYKPDYVFLAAAAVGGIYANDTYPVKFIQDNLNIQNNVIESSYQNNVKKLCFLGSSCIYPRMSNQPIVEEELLNGPLEPTNEFYAIAKIAGIKLCQAYAKEFGFNAICLMPTNLYGAEDNFNLETSHVIPALIRKFHEAKINNHKEVSVWGSGTPQREFLHVDDLADACWFLMQHYDSPEIINVGTGLDISIKDLAKNIQEITGFQGNIRWDISKPDGTPRKLLDVSKLSELGWKSKIPLHFGLRDVYDWYQTNY